MTGQTRLNVFGKPVCADCGYTPPQHSEDCSLPQVPTDFEADVLQAEQHPFEDESDLLESWTAWRNANMPGGE